MSLPSKSLQFRRKLVVPEYRGEDSGTHHGGPGIPRPRRKGVGRDTELFAGTHKLVKGNKVSKKGGNKVCPFLSSREAL